jgi:hypothetical protein
MLSFKKSSNAENDGKYSTNSEDIFYQSREKQIPHEKIIN